MKIIKTGVTRIVFLFPRFVVKIPNFRYSHEHFLNGCSANYSERQLYLTWKSMNQKPNLNRLIAPSLFCSWFGLLQIQVKCKPLERELTQAEKKKFKVVCSTDNKKENFGWYMGRLVCVDYP